MNTQPPARDAVRSRWTSRDEATLAELIARKQRIMEENRQPVSALAHDCVPFNNPDDLADWMIANADAVRDALEPFDSGVRTA